MVYRAEVDGLRAIAVLSVMLYHAGFEVFGGGFVGVDVFFVISGYLITSIVMTELDQGRFSFVHFYVRRARRIFPAFFVVIFISFIAAWFVLLPGDLKDFSKSVIASSFFISNFLFWHEAGYFDTASEFKPLLHTWSLAVEGQFYFFFPPLFFLLWRLGKRWLWLFLGVIFLVSLFLSVWAASEQPVAGFYLLPMRVWELLLGSFVALQLIKNKFLFGEKIRGAGGWIGLSMILFPVFLYGQTTPFPGFHALLPTAGAALVIVCASDNNMLARVLKNGFLVKIGLISYSVYLFHQPVFSFARHLWGGLPSFVFLMLIVVSVFLGYLSWRFVEAPCRAGVKRVCFLIVFGLVVIVVVAGYFGYRGKFSGYTKIPEDFELKFSSHLLRSGCDDGSGHAVGDVPFCAFGYKADKYPKIALFGDSHSEALIPAFDALGKELGFSYVHNGLGGCLPLMGVDVAKGVWAKGVCKDLSRRQLNYVKENKIKVVVLAARWSLYTQGPDYGKEMDGYFLRSSESGALSRDASREVFFDFLAKTVAEYESLGVKVVVILQVPQQLVNPKKLYAKFLSMKNIGTEMAYQNILAASVQYSEHLAHQRFNRDLFSGLEQKYSLYLFWPDKVFCNDDRCVLGTASSSYYRDDDHLTSEGALLLKESLKVFFIENSLISP